jgi:hypothetical protein
MEPSADDENPAILQHARKLSDCVPAGRPLDEMQESDADHQAE